MFLLVDEFARVTGHDSRAFSLSLFDRCLFLSTDSLSLSIIHSLSLPFSFIPVQLPWWTLSILLLLFLLLLLVERARILWMNYPRQKPYHRMIRMIIIQSSHHLLLLLLADARNLRAVDLRMDSSTWHPAWKWNRNRLQRKKHHHPRLHLTVKSLLLVNPENEAFRNLGHPMDSNSCGIVQRIKRIQQQQLP